MQYSDFLTDRARWNATTLDINLLAAYVLNTSRSIRASLVKDKQIETLEPP